MAEYQMDLCGSRAVANEQIVIRLGDQWALLHDSGEPAWLATVAQLPGGTEVNHQGKIVLVFRRE